MCPVDSQTPWTRVTVGAVMEQTAVSPVSVTHPVSATTTVVLTTARYVKVSDTSTLSLIHQFVPCYLFSSVFVFLLAGATSCKGRCGEKYNSQNECHCNSKCGQYKNCCSDYADLCDGETKHVLPVADPVLTCYAATLVSYFPILSVRGPNSQMKAKLREKPEFESNCAEELYFIRNFSPINRLTTRKIDLTLCWGLTPRNHWTKLLHLEQLQ